MSNTNLINHKKHKTIIDEMCTLASSSHCTTRHAAVIILKDGRYFEKRESAHGDIARL